MIIHEISRGISHIEDLPIAEFIHALNNLHEYGITEKLDGAQILFGIDDNGFYTSRETKGGLRIYNEQDYGFGFSSTYMRSSHKLLEELLPLLHKGGLRVGDQIEAEVLYGELPNVVPYSADTNYLVFLRTTEGVVNIDRLRKNLQSQSIPITLSVPYTPDGRFIELREETSNWKISQVPKISVDLVTLQENLKDKIAGLVAYLKEHAGIQGMSNFALSTVPLNKCPDWCEPQNWKTIKILVKEKREEINKTIQEQHIPGIKKILLYQMVRNQKSAFGPLYEDGGWIEGIVLRHNVTGKMLKIVDKNVFGVIREAAWKERNMLTEAAKSIDGKHSFLAEMNISLATSLGHPELGTIQARHYLRKVGNIFNLLEDIDFKEVRSFWISLLEQKERQLHMRLENYEKEKNSCNESEFTPMDHPAGRVRTLQTFATTFEKIYILQEAAIQAKRTEDLVSALVGKYLA
jgi:hypothetical protein